MCIPYADSSRFWDTQDAAADPTLPHRAVGKGLIE